MALTSEDLLAISQLLDVKLQPIESRTKNIELLLENEILPRLQNIENCYTTTYRRYSSGIEEMEALRTDMEIVKKVVTEHSDKLQKIS